MKPEKIFVRKSEFIICVVLSFGLLTHSGCAAKNGTPKKTLGMKFVADIPLPGGTSRFDYQSIDSLTHRLYIAHLGADRVTVFDLQTQKIIADIPRLSHPHGVLAVPELRRVYVSATGSDEIAVVDEASNAVVARVRTAHYPDGIAYDPITNQIFVSDEFGNAVTVINARTNKYVASIALGGEAGNTHYDKISRHIFTAVQSKNELAEIDPLTRTIIARYALPGCEEPHGFLIASQTGCAYITGEKNNALVVFDMQSKKIVARSTVGDSPDVLALDPGLHRLYIASESGIVSIFEIEHDALKKIHEGYVASAAHTVSVDSATHRIYFPLQNKGGKPFLRIMEPMR